MNKELIEKCNVLARQVERLAAERDALAAELQKAKGDRDIWAAEHERQIEEKRAMAAELARHDAADALEKTEAARMAAISRLCEAEVACATACQERDALAAELKAVRGDQVPTVEDINLQEWKGMDGACAWHLIDRYAEDWHHVARLMNAWLEANREELIAELKALREQDPVSPDLLESARAVVARWDAPTWKDFPATAEYIGRLRAAIAQADLDGALTAEEWVVKNVSGSPGLVRAMVIRAEVAESAIETPAKISPCDGHAVQQEADEVISLAQALEQHRARKIVDAVSALPVGGKQEDSPSPFHAGYQLACEEVMHRLLTEEWDGCMNPPGQRESDDLVGLRGCNSRHGVQRAEEPCIYRMRTTDPGCTGCVERDEDQPAEAGHEND